MQLRETNEFTAPVSGKKIVIKGYVTGRIKQELESIFVRDSTITTTVQDGEAKTGNVSKLMGEQIIEARNKAIELLIVSVDGQTDGILDRVLDLPEEDWRLVREKVDEVQTPLVETSDPNSPTDTTTPSAEEQKAPTPSST